MNVGITLIKNIPHPVRQTILFNFQIELFTFNESIFGMFIYDKQ